MTRLRHSFTAEFKLKTASLVLVQGYSIIKVNRSLDIGQIVIRHWIQPLQSEQNGTIQISKALMLEQ